MHQMSLNGKRDEFTLEDFRQCAATASMKRGRADTILAEVLEGVSNWPSYAADARVEADQIARIGRAHRLNFPSG
jgi:serine/threonine-protein kinase HipA